MKVNGRKLLLGLLLALPATSPFALAGSMVGATQEILPTAVNTGGQEGSSASHNIIAVLDEQGKASYTSANYTLQPGFANLAAWPSTILNLSASTGSAGGSILLGWTSPKADGSTGTTAAYEIRVSTIEGESPALSETKFFLSRSATDFVAVPSPGFFGTTEQFTITGLEGGTTYYFAVKARASWDGWSYLSNGATVQARLYPPAFSSFTEVFSSSVQFNWSANGNGSRALYRVLVSTAPDPLSPGGALVTSSDTYNVSLSSAGLAADTTYYFRVAALMNGSVFTAYTAPQGISTLLAFDPVFVDFTNILTNALQFNWSDGGNPFPGTLFRVQVSTAPDPLNPGGAVVTTSDTYNISLASAGLAGNTSYYFTVAGLNKGGVATAYTPVQSTSTLANMPVFTSFTDIDADNIRFNWSAGDNNYPGTLYRVLTSTVPDPLNPGTADVITSDTNEVSLFLSGLASQTTYYFRAAAINNNNIATNYSAAQSTVTLPSVATRLYFRNLASPINLAPEAALDMTLVRGAAVVFSTKSTISGPVTPPTTATKFSVSQAGSSVTWYTDPLDDATIAGNVTFNIWARESATAANATITAELLRADNAGNIDPVVISSVVLRTELTATLAVQNWVKLPVFTALSNGDRLAVRWYIDDGKGVNMAAGGRTVSASYNGPTAAASGDSWVQVTETLAPARPAIGSITNVAARQMTADWSLVRGATGYTLAASVNPGNPPSPINSSSDTASGLSATVDTPSLAPDTTYYFFVRSNWLGASSSWEAFPATATLLAYNPAFDNFTDVYASSIQFNWSANGNADPGTRYKVTVSTAPDPLNPAGAAVTTAQTYDTFFSSAGLAADTTYYFTVAGLNKNGVATSYTAVQGTATLLGFAPAFDNFTAVSTGAVRFNWAPNGNADPGTLYRVAVSTASDPLNPAGAVVTTSDTYNTSLSSAGLNSNTTYYFSVAGINKNGLATAYTTVRGTSTWANAPVFTGFTNVGAGAAQFNWSGDNPGGTLYRVYTSTAPDPLNPGSAVVTASDTYNVSLSSSGLNPDTTYYFSVAGVNKNGIVTNYTAAAATSTLLAFPPAFADFTNVGAAAVQFNWSPNGNADPGTLYRVAVSTAPDPLNPGGAVSTSSDTYNLSLSSAGLSANTTYYFSVAGINRNGVATAYTAVQGTSTLLAFAPAFDNFTNVFASTIQFNWSSSNPGGTLYRVYASTAADPFNPGGAVVATSDTYNVALSSVGLYANTTYYFSVAGINKNGVATAYTSARSTSTLARAPADLYFTGITPDTMFLNWSASDNGPGTLYRVLVSTAPDPSAPAGAAVTSHDTYDIIMSTSGLSSFTDYYFRTAAINNNGVATAYTAPVTEKTLGLGEIGAPASGDLAAVYAASITANWSLVIGATGYTLAASVNPGIEPSPVYASTIAVGNSSLSATVYAPALSPDTVYYLFVRANGPGAASAWFSYPAVATLLANAPVFDNFANVSANSADFNWSDNGNAFPGTLFRVAVSTAPDPLAPDGAVVTTSDTYNVSLTSAGLTANTTYYFRAAGINKDGVATAYTAAQSTATRANAPVFTDFTGVGSAAVQFNWDASNNPAGTLYRVVVSTASDPLNPGSAVFTASNTYGVSLTSSGLSANTTYYFRVAARGHNGTYTGYTAAAGTATLVANAPLFTDFTGVGTGALQFNWSPNNNAFPGTLYRVYASTAADPFNPAGAVVTASDTYNVALAAAALVPNTTYYFSVAGINRNGVATSYTAAAGTATLANVPLTAGSTFSALEDFGFTASWAGNSNPEGTVYIVQVSTAQDFNTGVTNQVMAATAPAAGLSYTFTTLTFDTTYYFQAGAVNRNGIYTNYTSLGSTRTLPLQAPVLTPITQVSETSIMAGWQLEDQATGYTLAASVNPGAPPSPVYASSTTLALSAVLADPALGLNTTYYLFVRSNGPGASSAWAAYPATSTLANAPVSAVSTFSAVTYNSFSVSWGANSNPLGSVKYTVEVSSAADFNAGVTDRVVFTTAPAAGPGAAFESLNQDTYYYFRVRANHNNGTFTDWLELGVKKTLALPVIHSAGDGVLLYGQAGNAMPQFRNYYSATNAFSAVANTVSGAAGSLFVIKTNPLNSKQEAVAGYVKDGTLHVLCTDGANWTEDWTQFVGGNETTRRFDIAYETNTGDVMVLYSRNQGTPNELGYRTKPGASDCGAGAWSAHADIDPVRTTGVVQWVKMASDRRADYNNIAAIWADANSDLSAMVWNGSSWENEPAAALETSLEVVASAQDVEDFDVDFESLSGRVMVAWSNSAGAAAVNGVRIATAAYGVPYTWGKPYAPAVFANDATNLDLAANPDSNEMVFASIGNAGSDMQLGHWSGSTWTVMNDIDAAANPPLAGTKLVAAGWLTTGGFSKSVIAYADVVTGATNIGWYIGSGGAFVAQVDAVPSPLFGNPQKYYDIQQDPVNKDRLLFTVADTNSDLFSKRLVITSTAGFAWHAADGGAALEPNLSSNTVGGYAFVYWPAPPSTTFEQSAYRFFANTDTTDVGAPLAAQDTLAVLGSPGAAFRLRALLHIGQVNLPINGQDFKLQFAGRGDGTCEAPNGGVPAAYTDVTDATLLAFNNNSPADNDALTPNANDPAHGGHVSVNQSYEEMNFSTNSAAGIARNQDGKWDFALKDNGASAGTSYCFRLVKGDGSPLTYYGIYPEMMVQAAVYLNEIYPSGAAGADDWVEFFNNTASTPSLVGWKLNYIENTIDIGGSPNTVWTGQPGDVVNAYSTFTVDNLPVNLVGAQSYHLQLLSNAGSQVDQAQWPVLSAGQSFARVTDGNPSFFEIDPTPTRSYFNSVSTDALEINEVAYAGLDRQFVEIYSSSTSTRTLTGYTLRNSASSGSGQVFRFTRKIYPRNYAVIDFSSLSDDALSYPAVFGGQGLLAAGDFLTLENSTGSVVSAVTWQSGGNYKRYNYRAELISAGNYAPANAAASIARIADTGGDSAEFASSAFTTLASSNTGAGTAPANTLTYPVNTSSPQSLARKFPLSLTLGAASQAGEGNNIVFERTGGSADIRSPHIYRLQDIGFDLSSLAAQATAQYGFSFNDQDGYPLVSSSTYRLTFNSDTGAGSAPQIILGTVTYEAAVHTVTGSTAAPLWMNNAARAAAIKLEVSNNSPAGFNSLEVATVTFKLLDWELATFTQPQQQARGLFDAVMLVSDSLSAGTLGLYEPNIDLSTVAYVPMASISVDAAGLSTLTVSAPYLSAAAIPAGSTRTFYVVFESTRNASAWSPNVFRVRFDAASGAVVRDAPGALPQDFSASAQVDTSSVTLIAPAQPPASSSWPYVTPSSAPINTVASTYSGVIVGPRSYIASTDGSLRALNAGGELLWTFTTSPLSAINSSPSEPQEESGSVYIYFANDNGDVYKVRDNGVTASQIWRRSIETQPQIRSSIIVSGSKLYFGAADNKMHCIDKTTPDGATCGSWVDLSVSGVVSGTPMVDDRTGVNAAWIGTEDGGLVQLNTGNGGSAASYPTGSAIRSSPFGDTGYPDSSNKLFVTSTDGKLYLVPLDLSNTVSTFTAGAAIYTSPFVWTFDGVKYAFFGDEAGSLHKVSTDTLTEPAGWPFQAGGAIRAGPVIQPLGCAGAAVGYVYFGSDDGYIYAVNVNTGQLRTGWPVATGGPIRADPVLDCDGTLTVGSSDGRTYVLNIGP